MILRKKMALTHGIILGVIFGLTRGAGVLPGGPLNASVGGNVIFTTTLDPTPLQTIQWLFDQHPVVTSTSSGTTPAPGYEDRVTVFKSTGSMELRNVRLNDSGVYAVTILPQTGGELMGTTTLNVQDPVSNMEITTGSTDLIELSSVRLSCSSSGSSPSFRWFNGSSEVTAGDRVQITDGGSRMTIVNVTLYDQGPFRCFVSNLVSNGTSGPVTFTIRYVSLEVSPPQTYHPEGSDVTLSCSAAAQPTAEFKWFADGVLQSATGPELRLMNVQMHQSGSYRCEAFIDRNMRNETSQLSLISVLKNISEVSVKSSTDVPLERQSLNLTCDASGSVFTKEWMKDGSNVKSTDDIMFYDNNTVLFFKNLTREDHGMYTCRVVNPISSDSSKYDMVVNYGPQNVKIVSLSKVSVNKPMVLVCSAESTPTATYTWTHNGTVIHHSSTYIKKSAEFSDSGEYVCQVNNSVTQQTESEVFIVEVREFVQVLGGAVTGMICALVTVVVIGGVVGCYFCTKKYENLRPDLNIEEHESDAASEVDEEL